MSILYKYFFTKESENSKTDDKEDESVISDIFDLSDFTIVEFSPQHECDCVIDVDDIIKYKPELSIKFKHNIVNRLVKPTIPFKYGQNIQSKYNTDLQDILNVKLRPTVVNIKPLFYPPRNPVIFELNERFGLN